MLHIKIDIVTDYVARKSLYGINFQAQCLIAQMEVEYIVSWKINFIITSRHQWQKSTAWIYFKVY